MINVSVVLMVLAVVALLLAALNITAPVNLFALGMFLWATEVLIQMFDPTA